MTQKTGVMMLNIQFCITEINYIFHYTVLKLVTKQLFSNVRIFHNIAVLLYFLIK